MLTTHKRSPIRLLLVDEPGIMRDGLCALLTANDEFEILGALADASEALQILERSTPDVLILDFSHARTAGHELIAAVKARYTSTRILVLTFRRDDSVIDAALHAGADGYVLKNDSRNDLFMALRSIATGRGYISPSICNRVVSGYVRARDRKRSQASVGRDLTDRERQIMRLIAVGHRTREMADLLSLSPKTIEKHRANIMRKLRLRNASAVAAYAIANGYVEV